MASSDGKLSSEEQALMLFQAAWDRFVVLAGEDSWAGVLKRMCIGGLFHFTTPEHLREIRTEGIVARPAHRGHSTDFSNVGVAFENNWVALFDFKSATFSDLVSVSSQWAEHWVAPSESSVRVALELDRSQLESELVPFAVARERGLVDGKKHFRSAEAWYPSDIGWSAVIHVHIFLRTNGERLQHFEKEPTIQTVELAEQLHRTVTSTGARLRTQ